MERAYWHDRTQWQHTASIMAAIANSQRTEKDGLIEPKELSPYTATEKSKSSTINLTRNNIQLLRAFAGRKP